MQKRHKLALLVKRLKEADPKSNENRQKLEYNKKKKTWKKVTVTGSYYSQAVRMFYPELKNKLSTDNRFRAAVQFARRSLVWLEKSEKAGNLGAPSKKEFRAKGGGRKHQAPEVREGLFQVFIDIRHVMKGRLPMSLMQEIAVELYDNWKKQQPEPIPKKQQLSFSRQWMKGWIKEYGVSLKMPNKRFKVKQDVRIKRVLAYLKNILKIRVYFKFHFGTDPPMINGDQMPLHRNEVSHLKTLNLKNEDVFVKENHQLSRERVTVFTQVASVDDIELKEEFVFKGKGKEFKKCSGVNIFPD